VKEKERAKEEEKVEKKGKLHMMKY